MKFSDKDIYENFQIVKNLPLVHKLMKKIEKLKNKNKELKQVVKILTKVECSKPKLEKAPTMYDGVEIKQEPYDDDVIEIIEEPNIEFKVIDLEEKEYVKCNECDNTFSKGGYEKRHGLCYECYSKREIENIVSENTVEEHESITEEAESDEYEEVEDDEEEEGDNGGDSPVEEAESDEYEEVEDDEEEEGGNGGISPVEEEKEGNGGMSPMDEDNGEDSSVEEDEEVIEVTIKGKTYYTTDEQNGIIYDIDENGDISVEVGKYKNGKPIIKKNS